VETNIYTIREKIYYSGYIVESEWRTSGEYMETDIYIIQHIYTYHNFEHNIFTDNNE
jgi:hypothetical protein